MNSSATHILTEIVPRCLDMLETIGITWRNSRVCANYIRPIFDDVSRPYKLNIIHDLNTAADDVITTDTLKALLFADRLPQNDEGEPNPSHEPVIPAAAPSTDLDARLFDFPPFDLPFDLPLDWNLNSTEFLSDV